MVDVYGCDPRAESQCAESVASADQIVREINPAQSVGQAVERLDEVVGDIQLL